MSTATLTDPTMTLLTLDFPIEVNGISLRFIPVRPPNYLDHNEAMRLSLRKRDGEKAKLVERLAGRVAKCDMAKAVYGLTLMRQISGLPFSALLQLELTDQQKFSDYMASSVKDDSANA